MSKYMLDDTNLINDINPFVMFDFSLPGERLSPHAFAERSTEIVKDDTPEETESPICGYGITAGDKTIDMCRPVKPNCPLNRGLYPGRNIDTGFTRTYVPTVSVVHRKNANFYISFIIIAILLIVLLR